MLTTKAFMTGWAAMALLALPAFGQSDSTSNGSSLASKVAVWQPAAGSSQLILASDQQSAGSAKLLHSASYYQGSDEVIDTPQESKAPAEAPATGGGCCAAAECDSCCCEDDCWQHRSSVFFESLYLHPTGIDVAHAIQQNGAGGAGTVPAGRVGVVDLGYKPGYRTGVNLAVDDCQSIWTSYTNYHSHATDSIALPPGIGGAVASLVLHPNSINAGSTSTLIDADYAIRFQYVDMAYTRLLSGGCNYAANYTLGVRYGNLKQNFSQFGAFTQPNGSILTTTNIDLDGIGLRTGLDYRRCLGKRGLSVYGQGFISVLFGEFNSDLSQVDTTSGTVQARSNWSDERVVPILEYELGMSWTSCNGRWRASTGYHTEFWYNAITTAKYIQAVQRNDFTNVGHTIAFDGLKSEVEFRF